MRTQMHLYYLKAQWFLAQNLSNQAEHADHVGKEIAFRLQAKADVQRFEQLIDTFAPQ